MEIVQLCLCLSLLAVDPNPTVPPINNGNYCDTISLIMHSNFAPPFQCSSFPLLPSPPSPYLFLNPIPSPFCLSFPPFLGPLSLFPSIYSSFPPSIPPGTCAAAGYLSCCEIGFCAGYPASCFCDYDCYQRGDCCHDTPTTCPESTCL